jgi:uncharacterized membrane protein YfhO
MVHDAVVATDQEDAWARIHQEDFDPATTVVLEDGQALEGQSGTESTVQVIRYEPGAIEIQVEAGAEGYLFLSDPFYPGWQAELDGEPAGLLRANYAFRAVRVPAGSHQVTMAFRSGTWMAGLLLTLLTALLLVGFGILALVRRTKYSQQGNEEA